MMGRRMRGVLRIGLLLTVAWSLASVAGTTAPGGAEGAMSRSAPLLALQSRAAAIARASPSRVGLAAIDLTSGEMVSVNGGERFPMASTVKVAIAALFLRDVQAGRLELDAPYAMPRAERKLARRLSDMRTFRRDPTGSELIDAMLTRSDNSAADILLGAVGGTDAVERWLKHAGVLDQRVDRSIAQLLNDHQTRRREHVGRARHRHWIEVSVPRAARAGDDRDSSTPEAMAMLLAKLRSGQLLDAERTSYLFGIMARCRTGPRRIRGLLPAGTPVAHKTGTLDGVTNDVGIVSLPNGHDLAIAVFAHGKGSEATRDRSIAQLSRLLYDGFTAAGWVASSLPQRPGSSGT